MPASGVAPRDISQFCAAFEELGMPIKYNISGSMVFIHYIRDL